MIEEKLSNKKQNLLIMMCWLAYIISYISRYSYNANQVAIISYYGTTKTIAGLVGTFYFISYGVGQVIHGLLCKRYNKQFIIAIALTVSAGVNFTLFFKPSFEIYKYMWLINGAFLGILWPTLICILGEKLDNAHLNKSIFIMSTTVAIGTAVTYGLSALYNINGQFQYSFLTGAILAIAMAILWFLFYNNFSNTGIEIKTKATQDAVITTEDKGERKSAIIMLIILGLFAVIVNFAKDGLTTWVPSILKEEYKLADSLSIILTIVLPIIGIFGAVFAVTLNKKIKSYIALSGVMFAIALVCIVGVVLTMYAGANINIALAIVIILLCFAITNLVMHGANNVITSIAPLQMRESFSAGGLAGILNGCCYIGSAISSFGMGAIADKLSWIWVFIILAIATGVAVVIAIVCELIVLLKNKKTIKE